MLRLCSLCNIFVKDIKGDKSMVSKKNVIFLRALVLKLQSGDLQGSIIHDLGVSEKV